MKSNRCAANSVVRLRQSFRMPAPRRSWSPSRGLHKMIADRRNTIVATPVPENRRMAFLPRVFGERLMLVGENLVYSWAKFLSPDYRGGLWSYYDLSNGAFYMSPCAPERLRFQVGGNGFDGEMSADA